MFVTYVLHNKSCYLYIAMPFGVVLCTASVLISMEEEQAQPEWVKQERESILRFLARDKLLSTSIMHRCFITFRKWSYHTGGNRAGDESNTVNL